MGQRGHRRGSVQRESSRHPVRFEALEPRLMLSADCPVVTLIEADNRGFVVMTVSRDLTPSTLNNSTVQLFTAGPDGLLGTADDVTQAATITYDNSSRRIRLESSVAADLRYGVRLDASQIRGTNNVLLDGEFNGAAVNSGNGTPGGDLVFFTRQPLTPIARFTTISGTIDVELLRTQTPQTVANFLNYANRGDYDTTFFHRLVNNFVIQGGGFRRNPFGQMIPDDPPVVNEPGVTNARGTIAMAKLGGNPNSATNEFFFNLADNRGTPPNGLDFQNGGFTAFARVTNASGLAVMDALAAFMTVSATSQGSAFGEIPVRDRAAVQARGGTVVESDLIAISRIALLVDLTAQPSQQLSTAGSVTINGPGTSTARVQFFDLAGTGAFAPSNFIVGFGANNTITGITLREPSPAAPVGIRITGATAVGAITDARTAPGHSIGFIISDARVGMIRINGPITGANLNGFVLPGGENLDQDIDGDGVDSDNLGIFIKQGVLNALVVSGDVRGDIVSRGGIISTQVLGSVVDADFNLGTGAPGFPQAVFAFNLVNGTAITSPVPIASIRAADWQNDFGVNNIRAPIISAVQVTGNRVLGAPGDFRAGMTLTGISGRPSLPLVNVAGEIGKSSWVITGDVGTVVAGTGIQNWQCQVFGNIGVIRTFGLMDGATIDPTGRFSTLIAGEFRGGALGADSMLNLLILGNRALGLNGNFDGTLALDRSDTSLGPTLGTLSVAGDMIGSGFNITGNINAFIVRGNIRDVTLSGPRVIETITLGTATNTRFTATNRIGAISAIRWDGGRVQAPAIDRIVTTGNLRAGITGDFIADIQANSELRQVLISGRGNMQSAVSTARMTSFAVEGNLTNSVINVTRTFRVGETVITDFRVLGSMLNSELRARGSIAAIQIGAMDNSGIYVGAPTGLFGLPDTGTGFTNDAAIRRFVLSGIRGVAGPFFTSSFVVAGRIDFATMLFPERNNNGQPHGFAANTIGTIFSQFSDSAFRMSPGFASRAFGDYQVRTGLVPPAM